MREPIDNEPQVKIKGGPVRASIRIDRSQFPALQARERVQKVLRNHCPDPQGAPLPKLQESDYEMVRVIAQEGAMSNAEPTVRYKAIAALAASGGAENLNLLIDLANFGEDFYVRSHALLALGAAGMQMALPAIAGRMGAAEKFEQSAARTAVALIARKCSPESVLAHASLLDERARAEVSRILAQYSEPRKHGEPRTTPQRTNEEVPRPR